MSLRFFSSVLIGTVYILTFSLVYVARGMKSRHDEFEKLLRAS